MFVKKSGPDSLQSAYGTPIISENEAAREWTVEVIETCRDEAEPVGIDAFAGESDGR